MTTRKTARTYSEAEKAAWKEQADVKMAGMLDVLKGKVDGLRNGPDFLAWLQFQSRFHRYSFNNALLILAQRPDATMVAGFNDWRNKFKRTVRKGEKGIAIFAPLMARRDEDPGEDVVITDGRPPQEARRVIGYRLVYVFDVSQTEGEALPTNPLRWEATGLTGDDAAEAALLAYCQAEAIPVDRLDLTEKGCRGYYDLRTKRIAICTSLDAGGRLRTLAHECAHHAAQHTTETRSEAEAIAEASAMVVLAYLGHDISDVSAGYVAHWAEAGILDKVGPVIVKTARAIIDRLEVLGGQQEAAA